MRVALAPDSWLDLEPTWIPAGEAGVLLEALRAEMAWEQREIVLFGKRILQPRLIAWAGALPYRYSGQTLPPRPFTPVVGDLTERVSAFAGVRFNHVLANRYRDGRDSMGLHADDEPELGPAPPVVATLSFGASRRFLMVPRKPRDGERHSLDLGAGSLLVMGGACQARFRHGIPRDPAVAGERISLTFRAVWTAPPASP
jgi:alkylated DNA repair dioxygenase AlkB